MKNEQITIPVFQKKYKSMFKDDVIQQYNQDYDSFQKILKLIPADRLEEKFLNGWGVKEITAHISSWNLQTIKGIKIVMAGGIPWFFDDEEKINAYNRQEIERKAEMTLQESLQDIETTHNELLRFLEELPEERFHQSFGKMWKEQEVSPSLVCSYRHYLHHEQDIYKWLKQEQAKS